MKKVIYKKQEILLDQKDLLGSGGEADVLKYGKMAFKLYHDPSKERGDKLADFIQKGFKLPDNVACPLDLVYDSRNKVIGFAMLIAKKCNEVMKLSNKKFRAQEQVNANNVITVFAHMKETLDQIHPNQIFLGDFNDLNVMFNDQFLSVFIDVDSYQFGGYPCPVGTDQFLDPKLYGVDLSKKPYFTAETDYYSFAVMLFKSLLLTHPYGGVHNSYNTLFDRAKNLVPVFDKGVIYPAIALNPDSLSDDLLHYFHEIFKKGKRQSIGDKLKHMENSFRNCPDCGLYFHESRIACPVCHKGMIQSTVDITQITHPKQKDDSKCIVENIFTTSGSILFSKVVDNKIVVVDYNPASGTQLHTIGGATFKLWPGHMKNVKYDFYDKYLFMASENDLMIFELLSGGAVSPVKKVTTMTYDGDPMFGCSATNYYRLTDKALLRGYIRNGDLVEEMIQATMENQTWFSIGQSGLGLGFFRIFSMYHYFVFSPKGRYELDLPKLDGKVIETVVEFSQNSALLLRKTIVKGRTYTHLHLVSDTGEIIDSRTEESINSDVLRNITGKILVGSNIVHPTDAGIVMEKKGALTLKNETCENVTSNSDLSLYKDGIVSVSEKQIRFLKLIK